MHSCFFATGLDVESSLGDHSTVFDVDAVVDDRDLFRVGRCGDQLSGGHFNTREQFLVQIRNRVKHAHKEPYVVLEDLAQCESGFGT